MVIPPPTHTHTRARKWTFHVPQRPELEARARTHTQHAETGDVRCCRAYQTASIAFEGTTAARCRQSARICTHSSLRQHSSRTLRHADERRACGPGSCKRYSRPKLPCRTASAGSPTLWTCKPPPTPSEPREGERGACDSAATVCVWEHQHLSTCLPAAEPPDDTEDISCVRPHGTQRPWTLTDLGPTRTSHRLSVHFSIDTAVTDFPGLKSGESTIETKDRRGALSRHNLAAARLCRETESGSLGRL